MQTKIDRGLVGPDALTGINPQKILVCQQRQIGDVVLSTPAAEILKTGYPDASIHFYTEEKCAPVLEKNPYIDKIWKVRRSGLLNRFKQIRELKKTKFDLVIDFQQLPRCRSIAYLSAALFRLSFTPPWYNRFAYTHWIDTIGGYAVRTKMSILRPLGLDWQNERPKIFLTSEERLFAQKTLESLGVSPDEKIITVDCTHRSRTRRWFSGSYAVLIDLLAQHDPDLKFIFLYGPGEYDQVQAVLTHVKSNKNCVVPPMLKIRDAAAVLEKSALHIGNCSAPRHIALAVGTPTFTIAGSTNGTSWTFPSASHQFARADNICAACNLNKCAKNNLECLAGVTPDVVFKRILSMLY